jgi:hypothetical protein
MVGHLFSSHQTCNKSAGNAHNIRKKKRQTDNTLLKILLENLTVVWFTSWFQERLVLVDEAGGVVGDIKESKIPEPLLVEAIFASDELAKSKLGYS